MTLGQGLVTLGQGMMTLGQGMVMLGLRLVTLGQGQTVGDDPLMVFHDDSPITINHVGFTSVIPRSTESPVINQP